MINNEALQLFENQPIRMAWNADEEEWYFSVVDVIGILTEQPDIRHAAKYWSVLKTRLKTEGSELPTNCSQLKLKATDGKRRLTDVANTEQLFRLIQSIPSKKAEPLKLWLAHVAQERIDENFDPERLAERMISTYEIQGYSREWINQRLQSIKVRNNLTNEWQNRGIKKGIEYALLTDELTHAWSGMTTRQYKNFKNLKKENLRDNMTETELVLNMLAETATKDISQEEKPDGFEPSRQVAKRGGNVAGIARKALQEETKKSVITSQNAKILSQTVTQMIETSAKLSEKTTQNDKATVM